MATKMAVAPAKEVAHARAPWWERHIAWILLAPAVGMLIAFAIVPSITAILYAFSRVQLTPNGIVRRYIGWQNFSRAFSDPLVRGAVGITIKWMLVVTTAEVVLGLLLALLVTQNIRWRSLFSALLIIPIIMPPVSVAVAWYFMYEPNFGVFNYLLGLVGLGPVPWLTDARYALYSMMLVDTWQVTPFTFLLLYAGLVSLPHDPYEAAALDGANRWQTFRTLTLPLMRPVLLVVVLLRLIDAARIFDKVFIMTAGGPGTSAYTLTLTIYIQGFRNLDFGYASALSFMFQIGLILIATIYVRRVMADYAAPSG